VEIKKVFLTGKYFNQVCDIKNQINSGSYPIQIVSELSKCDLYLAIDLIDSIFLNNSNNHNVTKVLIRQEPKIVLPLTYMNKNTINFDHIIDIGKPKSSTHTVINWPQDLSSYLKNPKTKNDRVVIVNSNLLSLKRGENYSLRRQAINDIEDLDLYGYQWNNGLVRKLHTSAIELKKYLFKARDLKIQGIKNYFRHFNNYLGEVEDKRMVISMYKYCLVIENSSEYLSEKIFDALLSGCIPIYIGPELISYEIPGYLFLQAQPNIGDIRAKIYEAKKIDYEEWRESLDIWLADPKTYENWSKDLFVSKIVNMLQKITNNNHLQP
jgi:hypothetical protein